MDLAENDDLTEEEQEYRQYRLDYLAAIADDTKAIAKTAHGLNWDMGYEPIYLIAQNPNTDVGTAKMLFWRSAPDYYWLTHSSADDFDRWDRDGYLVAELLYTNIRNGFYREGQVAFDPANDDGTDWTEGAKSAHRAGKAVKSIDAVLFEPTAGAVVDSSDLEEGYPPDGDE